MTELEQTNEQLEARLTALAQAKSRAELVNRVLISLSQVAGLDNLVQSMLQVLMETIGAGNIAIIFQLENEWVYRDIYGCHRPAREEEDPQPFRVLRDGTPLRVRPREQPQPGTHAQIPGENWLYPLTSRDRIIGVICMESMQLTDYGIFDELTPVFVYAGAILDNEVGNYSRLAEAHRNLQRSETLYRTLFEQMPDGVVLWRVPELTPYEFNSAAHNLLGYTREEFYDLTVTDLEHPATPDDLPRKIKELNSKGTIQFETIHRTRDGTELLMFVSLKLLDLHGGQFVLAIHHDITAQKKVEGQLRKAEARHAKMMANIGDVVVIMDQQGITRYKSPNITKWFGWQPEEVIGAPALANIHPDDLEATQRKVVEILSTPNATRTAECRYRCKDGSYKLIEITGVNLVHDPDIQGLLGNYQDITAKRRLEEQLRQAQKMEAIGQLAGGVAHDFNNILAAIMMQLDLFKAEAAAQPGAEAAADELMALAQRAAGLTRQLLMFSRRSVLEIKVVDLNDLVANLLKMMGRLIGEHIELHFARKAIAPIIEADSGMIEQVLMNLLVNARDAMPNGGRVTLTIDTVVIDEANASTLASRRPGRFVVLSVSDTGCGMDQETLSRIFVPFFTTKDVGKGTGLGLATVYGIVAQHKGWVEVESQLGKGSTFSIHLPCSTQTACAPSTINLPRCRGGGETILVVEDEASVRKLLVRVLRQLGYNTLEAANGREALNLWDENHEKIRLVITDMVMPEGLSGLDLAKHLRAAKPQLEIIIASGYNAESTTGHDLTIPRVRYLQKPYHLEALSKTIRDCLDQP